MSDSKAKMYQIQFRLGLCPRPRWGSLQRSPDPLVRFKGPTSKGRAGRGKGRVGGEERGGEGREKKGRMGGMSWNEEIKIWSEVRVQILMQDYESLRAAVMIWATPG